MRILKKLEDTTITEGQTVTFTCEVNKTNVKAKWSKGRSEIRPSNRVKPSVEDVVHTLTITDAVLDDAATYRCKLDDKETTAKLIVKGVHKIFH